MPAIEYARRITLASIPQNRVVRALESHVSYAGLAAASASCEAARDRGLEPGHLHKLYIPVVIAFQAVGAVPRRGNQPSER
jgi:hypothetical protein